MVIDNFSQNQSPNTQAIVGHSVRADLHKAVAEVLAGAPTGDGVRPVLCIAYAGVSHDQARVVAELGKALPGVPIVGGSAQGVSLSGDTLESDRFLSAMVLYSNAVTVHVAHAALIKTREREAGRAIGEALGRPVAGRTTTLLWYDPLGGANAKALVSGLADAGHTAVYGGATGQPWGPMVKTFQYADGTLLTDGAVAVLIDGLTPVADLTHGAEAIGLALVATSTEGNTVRELNGKPALDVWCDQLGVAPERDVENTANWALGVRPSADGPYEGLITRAPFAIDNERRYLVFQAPIEEGTEVQVCVRTQTAVMGGCDAMGDRLRLALQLHHPVVALGFECGARPGPFLGADLARVEILNLQDKLPLGLPWLGMYAWGEIAPAGGCNEFHNFTFPLVILCEPSAASAEARRE